MRARLTRALRCGGRAALVALLLQATAAVALAAALPEVGHVHPAGTPDHVHALVEVGGLGAPAVILPPLPRPAIAPARRSWRRAAPAPRPRAGRTRLGRDPPVRPRASARSLPPA